jgi:phosphohistidine phosphatase
MIWLLRHADAEDGSPDAERPLSAKGEQQARAVGAALAALGVELDACLASPRVRARDTARLVCASLGIEPW